jgi:xanthine dehydrogenase accessory factor
MEILTILNQAVDAGRPAALCTVVNTRGAVPRHAGSKMIVFGDGQTEGTVGGGEIENLIVEEALASLKDGKTRFLNYDMIDIETDPGVCGGTVSLFVEPYLQDPTVVVVGAGHVGQAVVHLASWLGFRVVVSDDRAHLCMPEAAPGGDEYLPVPMQALPEEMEIDTQTYLVLVTRGVDVDAAGIPALLETQAAYIGLIGSKRRWDHTREKLVEAGLTEAEIGRIKTPIGLEIDAETPQEIAVSIMAEIIALRNEGRRHYRKI